MKAPSQEIYANQRKEHNVEKYVQWLQRRRLAVVASQIREIPRNFPKIKVIQGHRSWC